MQFVIDIMNASRVGTGSGGRGGRGGGRGGYNRRGGDAAYSMSDFGPNGRISQMNWDRFKEKIDNNVKGTSNC